MQRVPLAQLDVPAGWNWHKVLMERDLDSDIVEIIVDEGGPRKEFHNDNDFLQLSQIPPVQIQPAIRQIEGSELYVYGLSVNGKPLREYVEEYNFNYKTWELDNRSGFTSKLIYCHTKKQAEFQGRQLVLINQTLISARHTELEFEHEGFNFKIRRRLQGEQYVYTLLVNDEDMSASVFEPNLGP